MADTAREINQLVQDAAKKKKELDKTKEKSEKSEFLNTAVSDLKKLEEEIKKEKKDYSKLILILLVIAAIFLVGIITSQILFMLRESAKDPWKTVQAGSDEISKAKEFVTGLLQLKGFAALDSYVDPDIPAPWKQNAKKTIQELKGGNFILDDVQIDDKTIGDKILMTASCSSQERNEKVIFHIKYENSEFKVMRTEKIKIKQDLK